MLRCKYKCVISVGVGGGGGPKNPFLVITYFTEGSTNLPKGFRASLFVCFVALRPKSTAMAMAGQSVHLTALFSWASLNKQ